MKLTTAEFADNADSVEALTAKQKLLQKQFDEQAKKAEAAEKALKKMRDNGIEPTNPAYQKMQTNLNNTKADMVKIQKEIDDTSKKLKSSKVDWESVGETVGKAGKAIGAACAAMGAAIAAAGAAFFGLAEETREARENMGKLETSFTTAGHSAEDAKKHLYGVVRRSWRRRTGNGSRRAPCEADYERKRAFGLDKHLHGRLRDIRRQLAD